MKYLIGVQPTGKLHIGNYLGCLAKGLRYQKDHDVTFLIANYHSLTTASFSTETEKELKKLGCDKIIHQTPIYTELFFELLCKVNLKTLQRMPQYKDKASTVEYDMGILTYPVLMAADIVLNDPDVVIIGKDQTPHLDLTNDIIGRIGIKKRYEYEFGDVDKIMSLKDPEVKMSKSLGDKHVLYLFNEDYHMKLKGANTNELAMQNLHKIGDFFGVPHDDSHSQIYKQNIADQLKKTFN